MTFGEKSAWVVFGVVAVAYGWYLATVFGQLDGGPVASVEYQGTAVFAAVAVVALAAVSHIIVAATSRSESRDKTSSDAIKRYARSAGGVVVSAAAVIGMVLAMLEAEPFWVANVLLAGLVLAQLATAGSEIAVYRRAR